MAPTTWAQYQTLLEQLRGTDGRGRCGERAAAATDGRAAGPGLGRTLAAGAGGRVRAPSQPVLDTVSLHHDEAADQSAAVRPCAAGTGGVGEVPACRGGADVAGSGHAASAVRTEPDGHRLAVRSRGFAAQRFAAKRFAAKYAEPATLVSPNCPDRATCIIWPRPRGSSGPPAIRSTSPRSDWTGAWPPSVGIADVPPKQASCCSG